MILTPIGKEDVHCQRCGAYGLRWYATATGKWRLLERGHTKPWVFHQCDMIRASQPPVVRAEPRAKNPPHPESDTHATYRCPHCNGKIYLDFDHTFRYSFVDALPDGSYVPHMRGCKPWAEQRARERVNREYEKPRPRKEVAPSLFGTERR